MVAEATVEGPARRRPSWSLKTIVEDVAGRPIGELQDPDRPVHPYLEGRIGAPSSRSSASRSGPPEPAYDPVDHLYPPLSGAIGREYHGPEHEHHTETIERHAAAARPGPSRAPERLYLHYLLLHIDRLHDSGLRYLKRAVEEELEHRAARAAPAPKPDPAAGP